MQTGKTPIDNENVISTIKMKMTENLSKKKKKKPQKKKKGLVKLMREDFILLVCE
jgi:hypothetical protein